MNRDAPIGRSESQELEFKSRESLRRPASIAREVAAMLNSGLRGEVWIGVVEQDEVAVSIEAIEDVARQRRRVEDALVDLIEPSPGPEELAVHAVTTDKGEVLIVETRDHPNRAPYAFLKDGGRVYSVRTGARVRPLSRDELRDLFRRDAEGAERDDPLKGARARARERRQLVVNAMVLQIIPACEQHLELTREQRELLADPVTSGNRAGGWTYGNQFSRFDPGHRSWRLDFATAHGTVRTEVRSDGSLEQVVPTERLVHEHPRELYPYALLEYPTSALRLHREVQRRANASPEPCRWFVELALTGIAGWKLRPFSPKAIGFRVAHPGHEHREYQEGEVLAVELDAVERDDLMASDDRVALRLIRGVYRSFGYEDDAIPEEFDQVRSVLRMPG